MIEQLIITQHWLCIEHVSYRVFVRYLQGLGTVSSRGAVIQSLIPSANCVDGQFKGHLHTNWAVEIH